MATKQPTVAPRQAAKPPNGVKNGTKPAEPQAAPPSQALTVRPSLITAGGGVTFNPQSLTEVVTFAKIMADSGAMIPAIFRNNIGACAAITLKALHWGLDPFDVAGDAYIVTNRRRRRNADDDGEEVDDDTQQRGRIQGQVAYGAKLIHAVINLRSNKEGPLEVTYEGEGQERRCKVVGILNGKRREFLSPKLKDIKVQNSPLWQSDVDQQFHYYSTRGWARRWCPEVIYGARTRDEIQNSEIVTDEDREAAIDAAASVDVFDDDPIADDEPLPTAPLGARMSFRLEKCSNEDECKAVLMKFQADLDTTADDQREPLRDLYAVHLKRVTGRMSFDEAMTFSKSFRQLEHA